MRKPEFHEVANIFPLDEENIGDLAEDIRKNGQQVPIETLGGKIIDGRRRWLACERAGVKPIVREVSVFDPVAHVLSLNLYRRHLSKGQWAMVGARAREIYDRQAKERQRAGGGDRKSGKANLPEPIRNAGQARDQVGKTIGVSGKTIDHASKVLKEGTPELIKAVDEGRMAVSTAAILATEPEEKQREELDSGRRRRDYRSVTKPREENAEDDSREESKNGHESRGVGVRLANDAINCLSRIPKNDALRKRGFQIVTDWIRQNK